MHIKKESFTVIWTKAAGGVVLRPEGTINLKLWLQLLKTTPLSLCCLEFLFISLFFKKQLKTRSFRHTVKLDTVFSLAYKDYEEGKVSGDKQKRGKSKM